MQSEFRAKIRLHQQIRFFRRRSLELCFEEEGEVVARIILQVWKEHRNTNSALMAVCDVMDYIKLNSQMVNLLMNNIIVPVTWLNTVQ